MRAPDRFAFPEEDHPVTGETFARKRRGAAGEISGGAPSVFVPGPY